MAVYPYKCIKEHVNEHKFGMTEERPVTIVCPICGEDSVRTFNYAPPIQFNGSGFYSTSIPRSAGAEIEGLTG